jgi:hypothetical protein
VHSLAFLNRVAYIETHSLPLAGSVEERNEVMNGSPELVRTRLPQSVQSALSRNPPLELICVDIDAVASNSNKNPGEMQMQRIPFLCLYTKQDAFLLDIAYTPSGHPHVDGIVQSVSEPFESVLLGATSTRIIRIRPAPQRRLGFATMCPRECMAMLTHDSMTNEHSLHLHQGQGEVGTPLVFGMEQLEDDECITDFSFCQSHSFSLLSSLAVLLLKGSGDIMLASPVLFRGAVVPKASVASSLDYLDAELSRLGKSTPKWRHYKSAKQYLMDAFADDGRSHYITAHVRSDAFAWPIQIQGPVLVAVESDDFETLAVAIEPMVAGDFIGVAIGHEGDIVDFGLLSPTLAIPRFKFETEEDTNELNENLKWGTILQRVDLGEEESEHRPVHTSLALVRDPVMESLMHYVTPSHIKTISTNIFKVTSNQIIRAPYDGRGMMSPGARLATRDMVPKTSAWSCLDVSNSAGERIVILGAAVSDDANLGHVLISRLSNGSMVRVAFVSNRMMFRKRWNYFIIVISCLSTFLFFFRFQST